MPDKLSSLLALAFILLTGRGFGNPDLLSSKQLSLIPNFTDTWNAGNIEREVWVAKGRSVLLECRFADLMRDSESGLGGSYDIKWYKSNKLLVGRRFVITQNGNLNITRVRRRGSESDAGDYRCVISARTGVPTVLSSPSVRLIIADIRNQRPSLAEVSAHEGGSLRVKCQINSQPAASVRWRKGEQPLPQNDRIIQLPSGVLQIYNVQTSDSDKYKCFASNLILNKTKEYDVFVEVIPSTPDYSFISPWFLSPNLSVPMVVPLNGTILLECLATGVPAPTLSWEYKSTKHDWKKIEEISEHTVYINKTNLHISPLGRSHIGIYRCTASSTNPNTGKISYSSQETRLQVDLPPVMAPGSRNVTTLIGKTTRLNCSLQGESKHSNHRIMWYKDGLILEPDSRIAIKKPNQLIFVNSITTDSGVYQCMAVNTAGFSTSWTYFLVNSSRDRPSAPTNLRYILYSPTSVLLMWDRVESNSVPVEAYSIHYTELGKNATEKQLASYNNSYQLDGLKPNTEYVFIVRSYTDQPSDLSKEVVFRTHEDVPIAMPEFHLKSLTPTSIYVEWSPLTSEHARGNITGYKIHWQRRNKNSYYNVNEVKSNVFHHVLSVLHPGKTYRVQVFAGNSAGYMKWNDQPWQTITMPNVEDIPSALVPKTPIVAVVKVEDAEKPCSVKVTWSQPNDDEAGINGYILKYKQQYQDWFNDVRLRPSESSYIISDLESKVYKIKLRAYNKEGNSPMANATIDLTAYSKKVVPKPPGMDQFVINKVVASPESETVVHLLWEVSEDVQKLVRFYTIKQQMIYFSGNDKPVYLKSTTNSIIIDGLKPFSNYQFSVRAHASDSKYGPYSNPVPMQTALNGYNDLLPTPDTLSPKIDRSDPIDPSTIRLEWSLEGELPLKYRILYSDNVSHPTNEWRQKEFLGEHQFGEIGGLLSNKEYWFKIAACTDSECGEYSSQLSGKITAVLTNYSFSLIYWIVGLVVLLVVLVVTSVVAFYIVKYRISPGSRPLNGNGILLNQSKPVEAAKLNVANLGMTTSSDVNGVDGDYIPMLSRIHADLPSTPLDTKGGYPNPRVNGFTNARCNGIIRPKDMSCFGANYSSKMVDSVEECERLFPSAGFRCRNFGGNVANAADDTETSHSADLPADSASYRKPSKYSKEHSHPGNPNTSPSSATYLIGTSCDQEKSVESEGGSRLWCESSNVQAKNASSSQSSDGTIVIQ